MKDTLRSLAGNRLVWVAAAIVLAAGSWFFFIRNGGAGDIAFDTQPVSRGDVETAVTSSGPVSALVTVTVGSEVSGRLTEVLADFNAKVTKGQLLAVIDPSTFQSRVRSAEADLLVQQATVGSREVEVSTAQVLLEQARRDNDRANSLVARGLVSQNDAEKATNTLEQSTNSVKIAQANLNNARSQLVKARASLDQTRIDLNRTQIRSPVDGVVILRKIDVGQTVAATMQAPELFQIARDLSLIQIETKVDEADIGSIKENARATFTVDAYPNQVFDGRVAQVRINGTAVQNVVTYSVMVQADNPDHRLLPGMTANVRIITDERRNVLRVASAALRFRPPGVAGGLADVAAGSRQGGPGGFGGPPGGGGFGGPPPGGGGQRFGGGPPGGPPGAAAGNTQQRPRRGAIVEMTPEVMDQLGLDAKQKEAVAAAVQNLRERAQAQAAAPSSNPLGGGGFMRFPGGGNNNPQMMQQRIMNTLAGILTPEQMQKYNAMSEGRAVRPATVYVLNAKGQPEARTIRVGLADDITTEVVSGLKDGDMVIVRSRMAQR